MNEVKDTIDRTRKAITEAIRQSDIEARFLCPTPVWDNTGTMIGALIQSDVRMGDQDCTAEVSFVVRTGEATNEIAEKADLAVQVIRHRMQAKIRRLENKVHPTS